ncbi:copper chaperone [Salinibacillus kushneri]|uniref:Copper chaperone CopZ n=1 Tax=Salinibacillus kushneri TaxID=237682 RepID=A0A1H9YHT2_9BACI|nr:copper chaperone CopZ [Salinibacillus kushneri]SES68070.1 copper chaperone [Salinibacillus kushneri]
MQTTVNVQGMSCGHCVQSVKGALESLDGVSKAEVDLSTGKVEVTYDDSKVTVEAMNDAIEEQGYDVVA